MNSSGATFGKMILVISPSESKLLLISYLFFHILFVQFCYKSPKKTPLLLKTGKNPPKIFTTI